MPNPSRTVFPDGKHASPKEVARCDELRRQAQEYRRQNKVIPVLQTLNEIIGLGAANEDDWLLAGNTMLSVNEFAQAIGAFGNCLRLNPDDWECRHNLAAARFQMGEVSAAVTDFEIVAAHTGNPNAWTSLATIIPGCLQSDHWRVLDVRRKFAATLPACGGADPWPAPVRASDLRVRVGYMSSFFHCANYMKPVWALINGHDRRKFDISLFADNTGEGGLHWYQRGPQDRVHLTRGLNNAQLTALIRAQSLDIIVDLNGYSDPARLPVLTSRLARTGVEWFNMYATSAMPGIDWIVGDEFVIRAEEEAFYSEHVWRLPQSCLSFVVAHETPPVAPPPCLRGEAFTFGSLVSQYKMTPEVLDAWSDILRRAPRSSLLLANRTLKSKYNREYLTAQFEKRDVSGDRITFLPPAEHFDFLRYYDRIDLALDSFPYNGGTTTTEAIWQGVPVLTFDGDRWAARTSRTLLMNCHLAEFVASSVQEYADTAVQWATETGRHQRLADLRQNMRTSLLESDVCRISSLIESMEEFYAMAAGSEPQSR